MTRPVVFDSTTVKNPSSYMFANEQSDLSAVRTNGFDNVAVNVDQSITKTRGYIQSPWASSSASPSSPSAINVNTSDGTSNHRIVSTQLTDNSKSSAMSPVVSSMSGLETIESTFSTSPRMTSSFSPSIIPHPSM
jgi:hypothetical protein